MAKATRLGPAMDCLAPMAQGWLQVMPPELLHRISEMLPERLMRSVAFPEAPAAA
jgi:hypothetical protein